MKLFVATETLREDGDFSFTVPGELVHFPPAGGDCPDCGCERAMAGFTSHKATTCFVARELDMTPAAYADLLFDTLQEGGWVSEKSSEDRAWVRAWAVKHMTAAADMPVETPLRAAGDRVEVRGGD